MQNKKLVAIAAVGLAAAIAVPTIAFGNARSNSGDPFPETQFVAQLTGLAEVAAPGAPAATATRDLDGFGTASITFDIANVGNENMCWDLSYGNLTGIPVAAHIHGPAGPGANANIVIPFTPFSALGANSASGCRLLDATEAGFANDLVANPANFYVNVHTSDFGGGAIRGQLSIAPAAAGEAHLLPSPLRAYDSRTVDGPLAINATRTVSLASGLDGAKASQLAVPAGATGAIVTLTATNTTAGVGGPGGFLTMYNADLTATPSTSSINWTGAGQNVAVTTTVAVDVLGRVKVTDGANATDFVLDVIGYTF
jgi:hypothetical protein